MADPRPQGLLSNFFSGNPLGPKKPNLNGPTKRNLQYQLSPEAARAVNYPTEMGATLSGAGLGAAETLLGGIKEGLIGTGTIKRIGNEDKVATAAYDYAKTALDKIGETTLLSELGLDNPATFIARYAAEMPLIQDEENKKRIADGKPAIKGFGDYQIQPVAGPVPNPLTAPFDLARQNLAHDARELFDGVVNLAGDHPELAFYTKEELTRHIPMFMTRQIKAQMAYLTGVLATKGMDPKILAEHDRLAAILRRDDSDRNRQEEDKKGLTAKLKEELRKRIFEKEILGRSVTRLYQLNGEIGKALRNPLGYAWDKLIVNPIRRTIFGEGKILGRGGLNWGNKLGDWLDKQGNLGKFLRWGTQNLRQGLGSLARKGIANLGRMIGRGVTAVGRVVLTAIANAVMAIGSAIAGAIAGALTAVSPIIIGIIIGVIVIVIIVMIVLAPFAGNQPSTAAIPPGLLQMQSTKLKAIFKEAATDNCVPEALLLAIARREASGVFSYDDYQTDLFSTPNWQNNATPDELKAGYCYNTCSDPSLGCTGSDVRGAMQFEAGTFAGYTSQLQSQLGHTPDRCNLKDSIYAAALKIKANSGTDAASCTGWNDHTVRQVAQSYCGSCSGQACGQNYCDAVSGYYRAYQALALAGNNTIIQAIAATPKLSSGLCGAYVDDVLAAAGYPRIGSAYAVNFYSDAPSKGYQVYPGYSATPEIGDIVVFKSDNSSQGQPGHVDFVTYVDQNYIYLSGNDYDFKAYVRNGNAFTPPPGVDSTLSQVGIIRLSSQNVSRAR